MIRYKEINENYIDVYLSSKKVGRILRVGGGYQYRPKGSSSYGEVYSTIDKVKQSLES